MSFIAHYSKIKGRPLQLFPQTSYSQQDTTSGLDGVFRHHNILYLAGENKHKHYIPLTGDIPGVPKKSLRQNFLGLANMGNFWPFCDFLDIFGHFWSLLGTLGTLGHFWPELADLQKFYLKLFGTPCKFKHMHIFRGNVLN